MQDGTRRRVLTASSSHVSGGMSPRDPPDTVGGGRRISGRTQRGNTSDHSRRSTRRRARGPSVRDAAGPGRPRLLPRRCAITGTDLALACQCAVFTLPASSWDQTASGDSGMLMSRLQGTHRESRISEAEASRAVEVTYMHHLRRSSDADGAATGVHVFVRAHGRPEATRQQKAPPCFQIVWSAASTGRGFPKGTMVTSGMSEHVRHEGGAGWRSLLIPTKRCARW